ncbi:gluconokinase [Compostimonas suwonensis]|uniref:Gluconokinase n=1 Tax=Compostimonas suwonensis TaxID=1048394 RepID=A0A2M9BW65_9MICO|nr:gluconokinase [Compostimonas suwonensis]PJJ62154.1 gluconokinase [Compostimonas suwonensis]
MPAPSPSSPAEASHRPPLVIVMGVSGSGKSTVGEGLAAAIGVPFADADDLHPAANVAKMSAGVPLDDADRWPWLARVGEELERADAAATGLVIACSALKRSYRDAIRAEAPSTFFLQLDGSPELLAARIGARAGHFMPPALLASQLATLEPLADDEAGATISIDDDPAGVVRSAVAAIAVAV